MRRRTRTRSAQILHLAAISAGFVTAQYFFNQLFPLAVILTPAEAVLSITSSVFVFWVGREVMLRDEASIPMFVRQLCVGTGMNLIVQAVLSYVLVIFRPPELIVLESFLATCCLTVVQLAGSKRRRPRIVLVAGFTPLMAEILEVTPHAVAGIVADGEAPAGPYRHLGGLSKLEQIADSVSPTNLFVDLGEAEMQAYSGVLARMQLRGIEMNDAAFLSEELLRRVCPARLKPYDLVLSPRLRAASRTMAIQAVYTNMIGLVCLLVLSPVLILTTIAVALGSGPGPTFEAVNCLGFQKIPFRLLRFRVYRTDGSGALTTIGRLIQRLHLVNLPQLVNVVRGEMALFGPRPTRQAFAARLTELIPYYGYRFSVKPGILGWAQVHFHHSSRLPDEFLQLEYDLYYVKEASPPLDLEVLIKNLFGWNPRQPAVGEAVSNPGGLAGS